MGKQNGSRFPHSAAAEQCGSSKVKYSSIQSWIGLALVISRLGGIYWYTVQCQICSAASRVDHRNHYNHQNHIDIFRAEQPVKNITPPSRRSATMLNEVHIRTYIHTT